MAIIQCPSCGKDLVVESTARLPPWCSKCGADLKVDQVRLPTSTVPTLPTEAAATTAPVAPAANQVRCVQCAHTVQLGADGRKPPWCPKCGADLKPVSEGDAAIVPVAAPAPVAGPADAQQSLETAIRRLRKQQVQPRRVNPRLRVIALGIFFGGVGLLALGGMFAWLFSTEEEVYIPERLLLLGGLIAAGGVAGILYGNQAEERAVEQPE